MQQTPCNSLALNTYQGSIGSNERDSAAPELGNADALDPGAAEVLHQRTGRRGNSLAAAAPGLV